MQNRAENIAKNALQIYNNISLHLQTTSRETTYIILMIR